MRGIHLDFESHVELLLLNRDNSIHFESGISESCMYSIEVAQELWRRNRKKSKF